MSVWCESVNPYGSEYDDKEQHVCTCSYNFSWRFSIQDCWAHDCRRPTVNVGAHTPALYARVLILCTHYARFYAHMSCRKQKQGLVLPHEVQLCQSVLLLLEVPVVSVSAYCKGYQWPVRWRGTQGELAGVLSPGAPAPVWLGWRDSLLLSSVLQI